MSAFPDYYALLNIPKSATYDEIRTAYKKESLRYTHVPAFCYIPNTQFHACRTHPDRLTNATTAEKKIATEKFQVFDTSPIDIIVLILIVFAKAVADAYYVLSDKIRRREYDALYAARSKADRTSDPNSSTNFFANFANMFAGAAAGGAASETGAAPAEGEQPNAEGVFADVFDDVSPCHIPCGPNH